MQRRSRRPGRRLRKLRTRFARASFPRSPDLDAAIAISSRCARRTRRWFRFSPLRSRENRWETKREARESRKQRADAGSPEQNKSGAPDEDAPLLFSRRLLSIEARSGSAHELQWNFLPRASALEISACAPLASSIYRGAHG